MASTSICTPQAATKTVGPLILGSVLHFVIFGVVLGHSGQYYSQFNPRNEGVYPYLVAALLVVNAVDAGMIIDILYGATVSHSGDLTGLSWTLYIQPTILSLIGLLVHPFLLQRCWRANKKLRPTTALPNLVAIAFLALLSFGSGLAVSATAFQARTSGIFVPGNSASAANSFALSLWLSATAAADLLIFLLFLFVVRNSSLGFNNAPAELPRVPSRHGHGQGQGGLLSRIVQTGALSALAAVLNIVLYFAKNKTADHIPAQFVLGPLYTLSVLHALLARRVTESSSYSACPSCYSAPGFALGTRGGGDKLTVNVHTVVETDMRLPSNGGSPDNGSGKLTWPVDGDAV
ncbi:hypothetical protein C8R45DRAFT_940194 [Mycena sanguinolenta]|nr:hypothetical protein C8R45DRAFT_940194 [Mycena sanguinolenta]